MHVSHISISLYQTYPLILNDRIGRFLEELKSVENIDSPWFILQNSHSVYFHCSSWRKGMRVNYKGSEWVRSSPWPPCRWSEQCPCWACDGNWIPSHCSGRCTALAGTADGTECNTPSWSVEWENFPQWFSRSHSALTLLWLVLWHLHSISCLCVFCPYVPVSFLIIHYIGADSLLLDIDFITETEGGNSAFLVQENV